jgi:hypothetical protein
VEVEEGFGDFDSAPTESVKVEEEEGFGDFDSAPTESVKVEEEEGFGDFDSAPTESVKVEVEEGFGDFDSAPTESVKVEEEEGFGDFENSFADSDMSATKNDFAIRNPIDCLSAAAQKIVEDASKLIVLPDKNGVMYSNECKWSFDAEKVLFTIDSEDYSVAIASLTQPKVCVCVLSFSFCRFFTVFVCDMDICTFISFIFTHTRTHILQL